MYALVFFVVNATVHKKCMYALIVFILIHTMLDEYDNTACMHSCTQLIHTPAHTYTCNMPLCIVCAARMCMIVLVYIFFSLHIFKSYMIVLDYVKYVDQKYVDQHNHIWYVLPECIWLYWSMYFWSTYFYTHHALMFVCAAHTYTHTHTHKVVVAHRVAVVYIHTYIYHTHIHTYICISLSVCK